MKIKTVGVMSPGDMGSGVGGVLRKNGLTVLTALDGRTAGSKRRAAEQGMEDVGSIDDLVRASDLILSILVPSQALSFSQNLADAIVRTAASVTVADCNAVSPSTAIKIGEIISSAGARFIDAGIIGGSPRIGAVPRFYSSGENATILGQLDGKGISVPVMNGPIGHASGIKMCYAAISKGTLALYAATLMSAQSLGLLNDLMNEMRVSQAKTLAAMEGVNSISAKAFRWIGEMEEIAATFESAGATQNIHLGAAETFRRIADSSIGHERVDTVDASRNLEQTIQALITSKA